MPRVCHIYASNAKKNSGDFMLGISTKKYFEEVILKMRCDFVDLDCRNHNLFSNKNIEKINEFDFIVVGGGGLLLPDSAPNNNSCWQWNIKKEDLQKITKPIYVISIGYNVFFNQNMSMPNLNNNATNPRRIMILRDNLRVLIDKSVQFSLRHHSDVENVIRIVGEDYREKVKYEMCPTVWYVRNKWNIPRDNMRYTAIEIKDDREWRRYYKIGKQNYYRELEKIVKYHIEQKKPICYLSHDGSQNFYRYLLTKNIRIPYLDNSCANERKIMQNYSNIKTILCSAGHSQMMSYGCGINIISMVSHPKLRNFCDDINDKNYIEINETREVFKKFLTIKI